MKVVRRGCATRLCVGEKENDELLKRVWGGVGDPGVGGGKGQGGSD